MSEPHPEGLSALETAYDEERAERDEAIRDRQAQAERLAESLMRTADQRPNEDG